MKLRTRAEGVQFGFTLAELLVTVSIVLTISALAVPNFLQAIERARVARAVAEISTIEREIATYEVLSGKLPVSLEDLGRGEWIDPWGHEYQYLNFSTLKGGKGAMRKDRFLVPLNSSYDLYSMGKDGRSVPPITAKISQDDILRANDGGFIGLASQY